ncbi:MAG: lipoprotein-releasing ABC transporter permease subunit [Gammaproteobacteria bacterium]
MLLPLPVYIGLRYTRARRRTHFISFISLTSMLGIALGVTALITVMSVMNGFDQELRTRILGMTAHATVLEPGSQLRDWERVVQRLAADPRVRGSAPFVEKEAMVTHAGSVQGVMVRGVLPALEPRVSAVGRKMVSGSLDRLVAGGFGVVLGRELADALQAGVGDRITLVAPQPSVTPAGILPRLKQFTVVGVFEIGMHEYDSALVLTHLEDARRLFRFADGVTGVRVELDDVFAAPRMHSDLENLVADAGDARYQVMDWTEYHVNFFKALKTEKAVMFVILTLIVAVAAFNIVSMLVMVVADKRAEVAILRTLGLSPAGIMAIFVVQGTVIGIAGTAAGVVAGVALAQNLEAIVKWIETHLKVRFLPPDVYYISELPSRMHWPDVGAVAAIAFCLSMLATLYPAWQAARTQPAEALRHE